MNEIANQYYLTACTIGWSRGNEHKFNYAAAKAHLCREKRFYEYIAPSRWEQEWCDVITREITAIEQALGRIEQDERNDIRAQAERLLGMRIVTAEGD